MFFNSAFCLKAVLQTFRIGFEMLSRLLNTSKIDGLSEPEVVAYDVIGTRCLARLHLNCR